jgi:hypothetical protein
MLSSPMVAAIIDAGRSWGVDGFGVIDSAQVRRGDTEVCVSELAFYDD